MHAQLSCTVRTRSVLLASGPRFVVGNSVTRVPSAPLCLGHWVADEGIKRVMMKFLVRGVAGRGVAGRGGKELRMANVRSAGRVRLGTRARAATRSYSTWPAPRNLCITNHCPGAVLP